MLVELKEKKRLFGVLKEIKANHKEVEYLKGQIVRHELEDYRFYAMHEQRLSEQIDLLQYKLNGDIQAIKTGESTGGSSQEGNWIIAARAKLDEVWAKYRDVTKHTSRVENWLEIVEEEIDHETRKALTVYAIREGYQNLDACTGELGYKYSRQLLRAVDRAIACIVMKDTNF